MTGVQTCALPILFDGAAARLLEQTSAYYRRRCGEEELSPPAGIDACAAAMFLGLLDSWLCGDLRQTPEALTARVEESVRLGMLGAVWQNFPRWGQREQVDK